MYSKHFRFTRMSQCLWGIFSGIMLFGNSSVEMYLWNSFVENLLGNPLSPFIQAYMFIRNLRVWIGLPCPPQPLLFHICAGCTKGVFHVGEGAWVPWDFFRSVNPISSRNQGRLCPHIATCLLTYILAPLDFQTLLRPCVQRRSKSLMDMSMDM